MIRAMHNPPPYRPVHSAPPRGRGRPNRLIITCAVIVGAAIVGAAAVATQDAPTSAPENTSATQPASPAAANKPSATALRSYLKANFVDATWYPSIRKVELLNGAPWITTTLTSHTQARPVCSAASAWAIERYGKDHFPGVSVRAVDGSRLVLRTSLGQSC